MSEPARAPESAIQVRDFLNPASMLTPGLAGALTMMISNALFHAFGLNAAYTALILSFMLGTIVWVATAAILARCIYYVFNSLIIFSVAFGTNSFGLTTSASSISLNFASAAYAQTGPQADIHAKTLSGVKAKAPAADIRALLNELVRNAAMSGSNDPTVIAQKNNLSALLTSTDSKSLLTFEPKASASTVSVAATPMPSPEPKAPVHTISAAKVGITPDLKASASPTFFQPWRF